MNKACEGLYDPADDAWIGNGLYDAGHTKLNIMGASNVIFENCTVLNAAFNIGDGGGNNNTIRDCTFQNTHVGSRMYYTKIYNNTFNGGFNGGGDKPIQFLGWDFGVYNNTIERGTAGLYLVPHPYYTTTGNHIANYNKINSSKTGIQCKDQYNNTFVGNNVTNCTVAIYMEKSQTQTFKDTCIYNSATYDINFAGNNENTNIFINTHFDEQKVHFSDNNDIFKNVYYIDILTQDTAGNPINSTIISITNELDNTTFPSLNTNGKNKNLFTTGTDGHTPLPSDPANSPAILDYSQNSTQKNRDALHNNS